MRFSSVARQGERLINYKSYSRQTYGKSKRENRKSFRGSPFYWGPVAKSRSMAAWTGCDWRTIRHWDGGSK
jgi:hypothetical protein